MDYAKLSISESESLAGFEYARWHVINQVLRQGDVAIRSPLAEGRLRPEHYEEEFGTVLHGQGAYSFHVEPKKKGRFLQIVVASVSEEDLRDRVSQLTKDTELREN